MVTMEEFILHILELKKQKAYNYNPYKDLIYDQKNMMKALSSWNRILVSDEVVNVLFNRDFQGDAQKKIIKIVNIYRDHQNLIIMNIPRFQTLDVQIKNLTKMRISIAKRGAGVLQTPQRTIYGSDIWETAFNEKIEREWLLKGGKPRYKQLTTARGIVPFPPLSRRIEEEYQKIKNDKRANIVEVDMGIKKEEKKEPIDIAYDMLVNGKIRNMHELTGMALVNGLDPESVKDKLRRMLVKNCKTPTLAEHFWDKKIKKSENVGIE
jgi:hypothetical protein